MNEITSKPRKIAQKAYKVRLNLENRWDFGGFKEVLDRLKEIWNSQEFGTYIDAHSFA